MPAPASPFAPALAPAGFGAALRPAGPELVPGPAAPIEAPPRAVGRAAATQRLGLLWLGFTTVVMALAVLRQPSLRSLVAALIVYLLGLGVNLALLARAARRDAGLHELLRSLANGPLAFAAIVATGGFASPAWMVAYPAVLGTSRRSAPAGTALTAYLVAAELLAYAVSGLRWADGPEAAGRGALLLATSFFLRFVVQAEDEHHRRAEEAARAAERARASKQEAEARFRLAEMSATHSKMASLGLLAASVAHEINNPINTIINSAQIILDGDAADEPGQQRFQRLIISEGERVARVVTNLLQFARGGGEEYGPTPLRRVIEKTLLLISYQLEKDEIQVELDLPRDLPPVRARLEELQQVFLNLVTNSRFALLDRRRRQPQLRARIAIWAALEATAGGPQVVARVHDNGSGIAPEHLARVFDPFFTTKPREEGTGLGLSVCLRIVREHHGTIDVESVAGQSTTFTVRLPALESGALENSTGMRWSVLMP